MASADLDDLEIRVMQRLRREPTTFPDMVQEGMFDRSTGETLRSRLTTAGLITVVATCQPTGRGRPRKVYAPATMAKD